LSRQNNRNNRGRKKPDETIMNENIRARELRVLGDDGEQFGIISRDEALQIAEEKGFLSFQSVLGWNAYESL